MPASARDRSAEPPDRSVHDSLKDYGRGLAGGLLFSLPLLYTMEVWWAGFTLDPGRHLLLVGATFVLLLGYNRHAGLHPSAEWSDIVLQSIEEMGLGLLLATLVLLLLGRIGPDTLFDEIVGKVVVEAMIVAIGISVGKKQLDAPDETDVREGDPQAARRLGARGRGSGASNEDDDDWSFTAQVVMAVCGAVLFAANVAPTDEIVIIAVDSSGLRLLGLALFSMLLGGVILYFSDFRGAARHAAPDGMAGVAAGMVMTYGVALAVSAAVLWFFGRFDGLAAAAIVAETVVLGLVATIGASAGRLLLQ